MSQTDVPQITAGEVNKAIDEKKDFVLIDARTPGEFNGGKIVGAINIPLDELSNKIAEAVSDKNKLIYIYCLSGSRSDIAVQILTKLGYVNVFSMTSGLLLWRFKKYLLI
jgi:rhodanese-related sulfurtransferase